MLFIYFWWRIQSEVYLFPQLKLLHFLPTSFSLTCDETTNENCWMNVFPIILTSVIIRSAPNFKRFLCQSVPWNVYVQNCMESSQFFIKLDRCYCGFTQKSFPLAQKRRILQLSAENFGQFEWWESVQFILKALSVKSYCKRCLSRKLTHHAFRKWGRCLLLLCEKSAAD